MATTGSKQGGTIAGGSKHPTNNNPRGVNQHKHCPPPDDPRVPDLLRAYHRQGITDRKRLSKLFRDEHGIILSGSTVARRRRDLGLKASGRTTAELPDVEKRQLILDQMAKDPTGKIGAETVKARILQETGIDITRDWIRREMQRLEPQAFEARTPHRKAPGPRTSSTRTTTRPSRSSRGNSSMSSVDQSSAVAVPIPVTEGSDSDEGEERATANPHNSIDYDNHSFQLHPAPPLHDDPHLRSARIPAPIPSALLPLSLPPKEMLDEATPKMVALTQFLRTFDAAGSRLDTATSRSVMRCMEAAAMLERELARVASASGG